MGEKSGYSTYFREEETEAQRDGDSWRILADTFFFQELRSSLLHKAASSLSGHAHLYELCEFNNCHITLCRNSLINNCLNRCNLMFSLADQEFFVLQLSFIVISNHSNSFANLLYQVFHACLSLLPSQTVVN